MKRVGGIGTRSGKPAREGGGGVVVGEGGGGEGARENMTSKKQLRKFQDRLNWKMTHLRMPATSTPKRDLRKGKITKADIETAFGFDDTAEETEVSLLSPIAYRAMKKGKMGQPLMQRNEAAPMEETPRAPPAAPQVEEVKEEIKMKPVVAKGKSIKISHERKTRVTKKAVEETPSQKEEETPFLPESLGVEEEEEKQTPAPPPVAEVAVDKKKKGTKKTAVPTQVSPLPPRSRRKPRRFGAEADLRETPPAPPTKKKVLPSKKLPEVSMIDLEEIPDMGVETPPSAPVPKKTTKKVAGGRKKKQSAEVPAPVIDLEDEEEEEDVAPVQPPQKTKRRGKKKEEEVKAAPSKVPLHLMRKPQLEEPRKPTGSSPFSQLLNRYLDEPPVEKVEDDGLMHVDPKKIVRTYVSKNRKRISYSEERDSDAEYDFVPKPTSEDLNNMDPIYDPTTTKAPKKKKTTTTKRKKKGGAGEEDEMDDEARRWLEEKNKEFEDVAKVKLVIEQSFSDTSV